MAVKKYISIPQKVSGKGTFSDNIVGAQTVQGGGLTQGNFEFTSSVSEKTNRNFSTGVFSGPINLESLGINSIEESKELIENNFKVYPNFDLSQVTNFTQYGSLVKRLSSSVTKIINYFPGAIESLLFGIDFTTGTTATNIIFNQADNETNFELNLEKIRNPFDIDFSINATRNLSLREIEVSYLRNLTVNFNKYSLYVNDEGYSLTRIVPTISLTNGILKIYVKGNPFSGEIVTYQNLIIRPNDFEVNKVFNETLDEVENFLLNRNVTPKYTATFKIPSITDDGQYYISNKILSWPFYGPWNLDIITQNFNDYLVELSDIGEEFDLYRTNLISRFLTTAALKDFDTSDQKVEKILQIYGRSFDETQKFISALSNMNSVNYNVGNDIPSQLLKNLAKTLGWSTNFSPISNDQLLSSVFGQQNSNKSQFSGVAVETTPDELNYQYYRNLILNSAHLFKSKGTRKSIEMLLKLIGAPDSLVEINEYVYLADQRININQFDLQFAKISGGTLVTELPILEEGNTFKISGVTYTGYSTSLSFQDVSSTIDEYPIDENGYPMSPVNSESFFYQIGSGWYQQTPQHRAPASTNSTNAVFTGNNPSFQTSLLPFNYGEVYLNRFRYFPFMNLGFNVRSQIDNNKSWADYETGQRVNLDGNINAYYYASNDKLVINVKNTDVFLNPSQGILYDIWTMSRIYNYPIPNQGLDYIVPTHCNPTPDSNYPRRGGIDWTVINPQPKNKTFFEFAQTFWLNTINVRNRLFSYDGKTSGYPTLQSIYWRYLESEKEVGIQNNNYNYNNLMEYVQGLGSYWIKLIEQMVPATTIWNTGVRIENSIFHRQKYAWRRQMGCQLIPIPCRPCSQIVSIYNTDCPIQIVECSKYPWNVNVNFSDFSGVLNQVWQNFLISSGTLVDGIQFNTLTTTWNIIIKIDGEIVESVPFFNGNGLTGGYGVSYPPGASTFSDANLNYDNYLRQALDNLSGTYGFEYYEPDSNTLVIFNSNCGSNDAEKDFELSLFINFSFVRIFSI